MAPAAIRPLRPNPGHSGAAVVLFMIGVFALGQLTPI
jgi:hypothetical protein